VWFSIHYGFGKLDCELLEEATRLNVAGERDDLMESLQEGVTAPPTISSYFVHPLFMLTSVSQQGSGMLLGT
jgi:hypothetical protein